MTLILLAVTIAYLCTAWAIMAECWKADLDRQVTRREGD